MTIAKFEIDILCLFQKKIDNAENYTITRAGVCMK